ncbi:hypothetical protein Aca07nite_63340 [Actinoplanes capillaceus]|uniref:Uncharacterized protein n=1 Tax=Actinoplanes campanulatus TaxID=113559 RepID=A0ABQ3WS32_9ACTN|nr:hypothetical protein Aca07nite_63340 [Actinoplanes capillaceus]
MQCGTPGADCSDPTGSISRPFSGFRRVWTWGKVFARVAVHRNGSWPDFRRSDGNPPEPGVTAFQRGTVCAIANLKGIPFWVFG